MTVEQDNRWGSRYYERYPIQFEENFSRKRITWSVQTNREVGHVRTDSFEISLTPKATTIIIKSSFGVSRIGIKVTLSKSNPPVFEFSTFNYGLERKPSWQSWMNPAYHELHVEQLRRLSEEVLAIGTKVDWNLSSTFPQDFWRRFRALSS